MAIYNYNAINEDYDYDDYDYYDEEYYDDEYDDMLYEEYIDNIDCIDENRLTQDERANKAISAMRKRNRDIAASMQGQKDVADNANMWHYGAVGAPSKQNRTSHGEYGQKYGIRPSLNSYLSGETHNSITNRRSGNYNNKSEKIAQSGRQNGESLENYKNRLKYNNKRFINDGSDRYRTDYKHSSNDF